VRPAQYSVLILINNNPSRTQAEIGEALNIERGALTKMLHGLERRGWIKRLANDGRSHSLILTASGRSTLKRLLRIGRRHEANIERLVGPRRRQQLIDLLKDFG
jgi:DNA-binding MarR family transcriptional regulator